MKSDFITNQEITFCDSLNFSFQFLKYHLTNENILVVLNSIKKLKTHMLYIPDNLQLLTVYIIIFPTTQELVLMT